MMMKTLKNNVQLIGNLGQDIEFREFDTGNTKTNFSLATHDYYTNKEGEKSEDTQWHNIVAWGKLAVWMSESLKKGDHVLVKGKLTYRKYIDQTGNTKYMTEIVASEFMKLSE